jgi:streptogramin lyase
MMPTATPTGTPGPALFVTTSGSNGSAFSSVAAYGLPLGNNPNVPPSGTFTSSQLLTSVGIAVDSKGNVYVANQAGNSIAVYPTGSNGNATPSRVISGAATTLAQPSLIALDSQGNNVYVANSAGSVCDGAVTVFPASANDNAAPSANIRCDQTTHNDNTMLANPRGVALDAGGNIYVTNASGPYITIYPAGSSDNAKPSGIIGCGAPGSGLCNGPDLTQLGQPFGIALDSTGNIYVTNSGGPPGVQGYSVTIYGAGATGNTAPLETIAGNSTHLSVPEGIVLDSKGNIYVANLENGEAFNVTVYPPFGSTFVGTVNQAPIASIGAAISPSGITALSPTGGLAIGLFTP